MNTLPISLLNVIESIPVALLLVDGNGRIIHASSQAETLFGYTTAELAGSPVEILLPLSFQESHKHIRADDTLPIKSWFDGQDLQFVARHKDGREFAVEMELKPLPWEDEQWLMCTVKQKAIPDYRLTESLEAAQHHLTADLGHWEWDLTTDEVYWSDEMFRICGFAAQIFTPTLEISLLITHSEDRSPTRQAIETAVATVGSYLIEKRIVRPDGEMRYILAKGQVYVNEAKQPQKLITTCQDITEITIARKELQTSEARFQAIWDLSPDAMVISDANGIVVAANPAYCELYGYRFEEIIGQGFEKIFPLDYQESARKQYQAIFHRDQNSTVFESRIQRADGDIRYVETRIAFITENGQRLGMLSNIRDVTKQKLTKGMLRATEKRYQAIAELVTDYAYMGHVEPDGKIVADWVTDSFTKLLGEIPPGADIRPFLRQAVHTEDLPLFLDISKQTLSGQTSEQEFRLMGQDGRYHWLRYHILPIWDEAANRVTRLYGAIQDITDQKDMEIQLRQSQKMEAIGRLAGGIAHDFNNILTAILSYSDLLLLRFPDSNDKEHLYVEQIGQAAQRASDLTRQLLSFSRQQMLKSAVLNLNTIIENISPLLRRLIGEDVEFITRLSDNIGLIEADKSQLEQVLMNLAANARDAMPTGGRFTLETTQIYLDKAINRQFLQVHAGTYIMLAVTDSGSGMDQTTQARIFDPFFTTKDLNKGTGMGMAIVHSIIKQCGGYIWLDSELGKGTTFRIYLPSSPQKVETKMTDLPQTVGNVASKNETILLVEDEALVRDIVRDTLEMEGYYVLEALGEEVIILCQQYTHAIHMMLTDVVMPGQSGPILAQRVLQIRPNIKVLYMSGYTGDKMAQYGSSDADVAFLPKPFNPQRLLQKVRAVLDS